ncbi:lysozyme g-like protein 1 isoform X2 [Loxodonta africana]|uniref:lysozyme g-like protein 1 isoform X2 n=1 Tax=Loxodonta africana TaxID=9785 RepID=UPI000C81462F|nr:lysozyme g-like protein 1 isoform X2 [Loxodonta africana]
MEGAERKGRRGNSDPHVGPVPHLCLTCAPPVPHLCPTCVRKRSHVSPPCSLWHPPRLNRKEGGASPRYQLTSSAFTLGLGDYSRKDSALSVFLQSKHLTESSNWGCYGNIRTLETPGVSCSVGRGQGLNYCGVRASEKLAEIDMPQLVKYQPAMRVAGRKYCVDPALIAAILCRQARRGNVLVDVGNVDDGVGVVQGD